MATALQSFRSAVRSCRCRPGAHRYASRSIARRRVFSTTPLQRNPDDEDNARVQKSGTSMADLQEQGVIDEVEQILSTHSNFHNFVGKTMEGLMGDPTELGAAMESQPTRKKRLKQTFMNLGDPEPWEDEHMMPDDHDDMTPLGHGELEKHREMRHYARLIAWEMPLLSKLAKPFVPPTADMPLRFRYTTYMGEQHPAEKKVVLELCPADVPNLLEWQREKLKKLAGVRYNPEKDIIKMSCEMFETQAQNKRYLGDVVDSLLREARDPTDKFEDVPLYTRHHHFKPKPRFPKEWEMTDERRQNLARYRQQMSLKDQQLEVAGQLIDGIRQIEEGLAKVTPVREALPEMVMAGKGKGKKVAIRR